MPYNDEKTSGQIQNEELFLSILSFKQFDFPSHIHSVKNNH